MHRLFADWYKQADLSPSAELLNSRWAGVEVALKKLDLNTVLKLTRVTFGLPKPDDATSDTDELSIALKEADVAFPMRGNENLLRILAGVTLAQCIESKHTHATFAALCTVSAWCHGLRLAPSVEDLPTIARQYLQDEGERVREAGLSDPVRLPKFSKLEFTNPPIFDIHDTPNQNHWAQVQQNFQSLKAWVAQVSTAFQTLSTGITNTRAETSTAFTTNAERAALENRIQVLKEEADVLWWLFGEFSERFGLTWKGHSANEMCLLIGEELADLYAYFLPAPNTQAFLNRALSVMGPHEGKLTLQTVITCAPTDWVRTLLDRIKLAIPRAGATAPFSCALLRRVDLNAASTIEGQLKPDTELTAAECAYQMLVEMLMLELLETKNA